MYESHRAPRFIPIHCTYSECAAAFSRLRASPRAFAVAAPNKNGTPADCLLSSDERGRAAVSEFIDDENQQREANHITRKPSPLPPTRHSPSSRRHASHRLPRPGEASFGI